jgi:hypothetical protein
MSRQPLHGFMKSSQWDLSGITDQLKQMAGSVGSRVSGATDAVKNWYGQQDPNVRATILRSLIGAGTGATALGLAHHMGTQDPDDRTTWKQKALLGALLGGTAAAAIPMGWNYLRGKQRLPEETPSGFLETGLDRMLDFGARNIGGVAGGVAAGIPAVRHYGNFVGGLRGPTKAHLTAEMAKPIPINSLYDMEMRNQALAKALGARMLPHPTIPDVQVPDVNEIKPLMLKMPHRASNIREAMKTFRPGYDYMTRGRGFKANFKAIPGDPRVRLLAMILGGSALGGLSQKVLGDTI